MGCCNSMLNGTAEDPAARWGNSGIDPACNSEALAAKFEEMAAAPSSDDIVPTTVQLVTDEEGSPMVSHRRSAPEIAELSAAVALTREQSTKSFQDRFVEHTPMLVMSWHDFKAQGCCMRSDVARARGLLQPFEPGHTAIFVSHNWWLTAKMDDRSVEAAAGAEAVAFDTGAPDWTTGEHAHLKFKVLCLGVENLIRKYECDEASVVLWMDWFSIDQDDKALKSLGVASLIRYTTNCQYMLIPCGQPLVEAKVAFPEQLPVYGGRAWCRLEFFCFSCLSEMRKVPGGVRLFACGTQGKLKHFPELNVEGGKTEDLPSQGKLTLESDRPLISELEEQMIREFGHQIVRNVLEGAPHVAHLTAKLLRDEHVPTLVGELNGGAHGEECSANLTELHLRNNQIGDEGVGALTAAPLPNLEYLSLSSNAVGDAGADRLVAALSGGAWPRLRQLYLGGNALSEEGKGRVKACCQASDVHTPYL